MRILEYYSIMMRILYLFKKYRKLLYLFIENVLRGWFELGVFRSGEEILKLDVVLKEFIF